MSTTASFEKFNVSAPAEWLDAFATAAAAEQMSRSEWLGQCCDSQLPADVRRRLSEWIHRRLPSAKERTSDSNRTARINMSAPDDRRPAWTSAANAAGYRSLSEWITETGKANLPAAIAAALPERRTRGARN